MDDLTYIKKFSKITITDVCKKTKVNKSNLFNGKASKKNVKKVKKQIESDVARLYLVDEDHD